MIQSDYLFLVGFPGSGKSTLAPLIASNLGYDCIDTDHSIEALAGKSIMTIFQEHGEAYFRALEKRLLLEQLPPKRLVVACGGGVVTIPGLCESLRQRGLVIALHVSPATLVKRLQHNIAHRPLLQGKNLEEVVKQKLEERLPLYQSAGVQFEAEGLSAKTLADRITHYYKNRYCRLPTRKHPKG
jgi:shikimate kinase